MIKKYIKRDFYIQQLRPYFGQNLIKVLVGQRRVGKSFLLFQIMDELLKSGLKKENIVYINKEDLFFDDIVDYQDLVKYVKNCENKHSVRAIFIDEIQDIKQFEKALRHWQATKEYDIYCTGSNANLMSGELATYLSGRYVEIAIFSLSYIEFLRFQGLPAGKDSFEKYYKYGGLPHLVNVKLEDDLIFDYLRNIRNTIILKDVVARFNLRNIAFLDRLIEYLADNVGSLVSANKMSAFLKSQHIKISANVVLNYLANLSSALLIFKASRIDVNGKKIFEISDKYYFQDLGLRHSIISYQAKDISKILENVVYMHLLTNGYKVYVGQLNENEIDFVAIKSGSRIYVQVTYLMSDKKTIDREFGNLLQVEDNYPRYVVSMDEIPTSEYRGIRHLNIIDFLTNEKI